MKIITNNPLVQDEYPELTEFHDTGVKDIMLKVRNYIHLGAELVSHPVTGNLPPGENPYKSIVIKEASENTGITTDFFSLTLIENAINQLPENLESNVMYDTGTLDDFQTIDIDLIKSCIEKFDR